MKFSIVTISYNQRPYLQQAIESVLDQDYPDLEYIVVDPGSKDGSRELIERYAGRIDHIVLEPDLGAADGLNKGFSRASGSIFAFLNSDDALLPGALHKVAAFSRNHPNCGLVMGNGWIVDAAGKPLRHIRAHGFTPERYFYGGATWLQQATFFQREAFEAVGGFNPENRTCWDGELFLGMLRHGARVAYLDADLALFRVHARSITGSRRHREMMKADADRMFEAALGRKWTAADTARSWLFRAGRLLTRPGAFRSAVKARLSPP